MTIFFFALNDFHQHLVLMHQLDYYQPYFADHIFEPRHGHFMSSWTLSVQIFLGLVETNIIALNNCFVGLFFLCNT